jgi:uncharacterized membrane-anchored protein
MRFPRAFVLVLACAAPAAFADAPPVAEREPTQEEIRQIQKNEFMFKDGPMTGDLGNASINVPAGYMFTGMAGTLKWAVATSGASNGNERGLLQPNDGNWTALFNYEDSGHVKDDDKDDIDAKEILESYVEGTRAGNEARRAQGIAAIVPESMRWEVEPYYNEQTHSLEFAIAATEEGTNERIVNFNTKVLGRTGYMEAVLMFGNDTKLTDVLPQFRAQMAGFAYKAGDTYGEYKSGDKLAEYGLAALAGGGAVAIAAKTGLLAGLFKVLAKGAKLVVIGVIALGAGIAKLFKKITGREEG